MLGERKIKNSIKHCIILILLTIYIISATYNNKLAILAFIPYLFYIFVKFNIISMIILILFNESMFYIIKDTRFNSVMIFLAFITICVAIYKFSIKKDNYSFMFKNQIYMIILLICFEVMIAYLYTGQNIILGFYSSQRYFLYLMYFYINIAMSNRKKAEKVIDILILISTIISILYLIQSITYPSIVIFDMSYSLRNGSVRFYTGVTIIIFSLFLSIDRYKYTKKRKYLFSIITFVLEIYFVSQTRSIIIPLMLLVFLKLFNMNKLNSIRITGIFLLLIFIAFSITMKAEFIDEIFISVFDEIKNLSGTSGVRVREINFYMNQFIKSPLWGVGIYNESTNIGYHMLGRQFNYYQNDIGAIGFLSTFGIMGMSIFGALVYKANKIINKTEKIKYGIYMIYFIILSLPFSFYLENNTSILYILITICYIEKRYIWELEDKISFERRKDNECSICL